MLKFLAIFAVILISSQVFTAKILDDAREDETGPFEKADCVKKWEQDPVICRGHSPVFTWDNDKKECVKVFYSGCHKTRNNFKTLEDCQHISPLCKF